jgi:predicted kinase
MTAGAPAEPGNVIHLNTQERQAAAQLAQRTGQPVQMVDVKASPDPYGGRSPRFDDARRAYVGTSLAHARGEATAEDVAAEKADKEAVYREVTAALEPEAG